MKTVECTIKRKNGTTLPFLDGVTYKFMPNEKGAHVASVRDDHAAIMLRNAPDAYRLYEGGTKAPEVSDSPADAQVLQGDGGSGKAGEPDETQTPAEPNAKPKRTPRRAS